jgi:hypothetical protein
MAVYTDLFTPSLGAAENSAAEKEKTIELFKPGANAHDDTNDQTAPR